MPDPLIARVVVEVEPFHLDRPFDYLVGDDEVSIGSRVQVTFGGRRVRGLVVGLSRDSAVDADRLRTIGRVLGPHAWVREDELEVLRWAAQRFGAPLADVVRHALPPRTVDVERRAEAAGWFPPGAAPRPASDPPPDPASLAAAWAPYEEGGTRLLEAVAGGHGSFLWRPLPGEDVAARLAELCQACLAGGRDVLLLVPDPASPTAEAVLATAGDLAVDLRGGPSPRGTYRRWLEARCGRARVVIGERGAAFTPLERLGLAVVLDEANPAYKERRSPRHHAREVVLERARRAGGVGLAVGTVPSATAVRLLRARRLVPVVPERRLERRERPPVRLLTGEGEPRARLLRASSEALRAAVEAGTYGVVLAGRRGEGRALVCRDCGDRLTCPACGASLAPTDDGRLACEGCTAGGIRRRACTACGGRQVVPLLAGAQQLGRELERTFARGGTPVAVLEGYGRTPPPPPAVLVLTRGSVLDRPPGAVGAVVLPDLDGLLRRPALDAAEDALRLACQIAAWTVHGGRTPVPGRVVVQTREPEHPALAALAAWDPGGFWRQELALRAALRFPPAATAIRLDAPDGAVLAGEPLAGRLHPVLPAGDELLGPITTEGRDRYLLKCDDRAATLASLAPLRAMASRDGLDLRVDVDPVDAL